MTTVTIYRPAKTAMQSGRGGRMRQWTMEFDTGSHKFIEPLMGWVGSADTRRQVRLRFDSKEAAIAYAERNGFDYRIHEPNTRDIRPKSYADNFPFRRAE